VLEHGGTGVAATAVSTTPGGFPAPAELLGGPAAAPPAMPAIPRPAAPAAAPTTGQAWPGMNLEWPKLLPFGQSADTPPAGVGGGTVDPFKRARGSEQPAP